MKASFRFVCLMGAVLSAAALPGATLRVDPSDSSAYATIQAAVDAASPGDTVSVAPGTYATGERTGPTTGDVGQKCRLVVDKPLTFVSEGTREDTFIVGSYAGAADPKSSADAVSCVHLTEDAYGTTFRGFTFRDGALRSAFTGGGGMSYGSCGVAPAGAFTNVLCRFDHCTATKGGAICGGTAVATLFTRNWVSGTDARGSSTRNSAVYNCVFAHDSGDADAAYATPISDPVVSVNCTVVNCFKTFGIEQSNYSETGTAGRFYNLACFQNLWTSGNTYKFDTAVVEGSSADQPNHDTEKSTGTIVAVPLDSIAKLQNLLMAPMLGDFRPVKGGTLDGAGARGHLALIPEVFRNMDFNGESWDAESASVPVGAILPAGEDASNPLFVSVPPMMSVNGQAFARKNGMFIHRSSAAPLGVEFKAADDVKLFGYKIKQYVTTVYRAPDAQGRFTVTLGAEYNGAERVSGYGRLDVQAYNNAFYVDEKNGSDANAGTSADAPFATLQKAAETVAALESGKFTVVNVAPGVYSNGYVTSTVSGRRVRFAVPAGNHVWLRGTGGADVTVIEGASDPDAAEENKGCGPAAVAGVDSPNSSFVIISGFTFRNCRSDLTDSGARGGAVRLGNYNENVSDCVFSNNVAYGSGAALYAGDAHRCRFSDNLSLASENPCVLYGVRADACVFENLKGGCAAYNSYLFNCTLNGAGAESSTVLIPGSTHAYNCIGVGGGTIAALWNTGNMMGCAFWKLDSVAAAQGWTEVNPLLAAVARGDYRPLAGSPAFTSGSIDVVQDEFYRYTTTDIHGNPLFVTGDERIVGADATARLRRRHYVATDGDDAADGLTRATARRTLAAAVTGPAVSAGDIVEAAPGTYEDGSAVHVGASCDYVSPMPAPTLPSRVVVPCDVSLVSRDGAAATVIRGGENVRCAFLEDGARLDGFTLTGGSLPLDAADSDDGSAAGVLGRRHDTSLAANCVVTDCSSWCAPAACKVTLDHCVVSNNVTPGRELLRHTSLHNCLIDGNRSAYTIYAFGTVVNTTVGTNNCRQSGGAADVLITPMNAVSSAVVNSLFLQNVPAVVRDMQGITVKNCIFTEPACYSGAAGFENVITNFSRAEAALCYDAAGRAVSLSAPSVDAGVADIRAGETDVAGGKRVLNGTIDIGAFEYDCRADYLAGLSAPRYTEIGDISSSVVAAGGKIVLACEDDLELTFSGRTGGYWLEAEISDGAALAVYRNGVRLGTLESSGTFYFTVATPGDRIRLVAESADGTGSVSLVSLASGNGLKLFIR